MRADTDREFHGPPVRHAGSRLDKPHRRNYRCPLHPEVFLSNTHHRNGQLNTFRDHYKRRRSGLSLKSRPGFLRSKHRHNDLGCRLQGRNRHHRNGQRSRHPLLFSSSRYLRNGPSRTPQIPGPRWSGIELLLKFSFQFPPDMPGLDKISSQE